MNEFENDINPQTSEDNIEQEQNLTTVEENVAENALNADNDVIENYEEPVAERNFEGTVEQDKTPPLKNVFETFEEIEYSDIKKEKTGSGVKIFALVMAFIILMTASCTVGYVVGSNKSKKTVYLKASDYYAETNLELVEKPDAVNAYNAAEVYDIVNKSVVGITVYNSQGAASVASGVIYTQDGYIITNDHIYSDVASAKFKVKTYDGKIYDAVFVAGDTRSDLAVLKIDAKGFIPAVFGNSNQIVVGESVVAVGRPTGIDENSMTRGIISLKERRVSVNTSYSMRLIQTDTPINPGNSGGALVNMFGQVIGITSSKIGGDQYEGIGFAIPTTVAKSVVESLIKHGYVKDRTRLGISYQEIDEIVKEVKDYEVMGVVVALVNEESDLYGKIEVGDIITEVNSVKIVGDEVILDIIEASKPGDELEFTIYTSKGTEKTVTAKLLEDIGSSSYRSELSELD